jgi:outer membrane protein OmpA-like peptidoglycan-associated protein/Tol biopolymer transport system component
MQFFRHFRLILVCATFLFFQSRSSILAQNLQAEANLLTSQGDGLYLSEGKKDLALEKYILALEKDPENLKANYMAGLCYFQSYRKSFSLLYFLKVFEKKPSFTTDVKLHSDLFPDLEFLIAKSYQSGNNYEKAAEFYERFEKTLRTNTASRFALLNKGEALRIATRKKNECRVALELSKKPSNRLAANEKAINSPFPDYGPVLSPDGKSMFFTSRRPGGSSPALAEDLHYYEDIYLSQKSDSGKWGAPVLIPGLSTPGHESVSCLSPGGSTMYLSRGEGNGDLFSCQSDGSGRWSEPVSLGNNINSEGRETSCYASPDGKKLYFTSDRPGGFGGLDLYLSLKRSNGKWGVPVNLGSRINTAADEDAPSLSKDGLMLIFSSKGPGSMGGYDIMMARLDSNGLPDSAPVNLGMPANSPDDDNTFFQEDAEMQGYFASYRENGAGDLDIYHLQNSPLPSDSVRKDQEAFKEMAAGNKPLMEGKVNEFSQDSSVRKSEEADMAALADSTLANKGQENTGKELLPEGAGYPGNPQASYKFDPKKNLVPNPNPDLNTSIRIFVFDTDSKLPMDADVVFTDRRTKEKYYPKRPRTGVYELSLAVAKAVELQVVVDHVGYYFKNLRILVPSAGKRKSIEISRNVELRKHILNRPRILRNVFFDFDKSVVKEESFEELNLLQKTLNENPKIIIEVAGHADNIGDEKYNHILSMARARSVVTYLVSRGIEKARLRPRGYGENIPAVDEESEEARAKNRRSEFTILAQ